MKSWKVLTITGVVLTGLAAWSGTGQAQNHGSYIDQREAAQEQRIQDGIRSGALTPREAGRLEAEQQRIRDAEARMRADGRLNPQEKVIIDRMQDKAGRDIYREAHDRQAAYPGYGKHHKEQNQHWQNNYRRHHGQGNNYRKDNGCDRRGAFQGNRGGFSRSHQRDRRFAWN
jgi:hypothetical protein